MGIVPSTLGIQGPDSASRPAPGPRAFGDYEMTKTLLACCLSGILFVNPSFAAEPVAAAGLRMTVVSGDRSVNSTTKKANVVPSVVRLRTATGAPAIGVPVRFELIGNRELGSFANNQTVLETMTNAQGEAATTGYTPLANGSFIVRVTAGENAGKVTAEIHQRNHSERFAVSKESNNAKAIWILAGAAAAGVVLGVVLKSRGSNSPAPSATVSVGNPSVGGPH